MIGIDIIEIPRIAQAIANENFITKHFSENEIEYFKSKNMSPQSIAGSWAAKEAFSKALGTGVRGFSLLDIEVLRNEQGMPFIVCKGRKLYSSVSISHSKENAVAAVVLPWYSRIQIKLLFKI